MSNLVINLRGTSGAGKTTVVNTLLLSSRDMLIKRYGVLGPNYPEAVQTQGPKRLLTALGPYHVSGADSIVSRVGITGLVELIEKYRKDGDVLFEALIVSSMYGTVGKWLRDHPPSIVAVLNNSLETCLEGLHERQVFPHAVKTQEAHYHGTLKVAAQMEKDGMRVEYVTRNEAADKILGWLK